MQKKFDPEDPMELVGVEIPGGDPAQALDDIVQEYLFTGWSPLRIQSLFVSPFYAATHQIYMHKGAAYVEQRIHHLAELWHQGWVSGGKTDA